MNDRLVTALGALAALVVLGALLFQGGQPAAATRPVTTETGPNGYAALARWLAGQNVPVYSLRTRMDGLVDGRLGAPQRGNVMITTMPHQARLRRDESGVLWNWIADGNTLLVMAALDDTPDWTFEVFPAHFLEDLERLTGLTFTDPAGDDDLGLIGSVAETTTVTLHGMPDHPLMRGVGAIEGESDTLAAVWTVDIGEDDETAVLQLAREAQTGAAAIWQVRFGDGHVIVSGLGSPLTNRAIGRADNRAFVANLLGYHLEPGAGVIFDDMHQGLSILYDPEAFFADARLHATVLFVLGFWLLYLLGSSNRLAPPVAARSRPSQSEFVAAVGGFFARKLSPLEAGRLMVSEWFDELRQRGLVPPAPASGWMALSTVSVLQAPPLERLRRCDQVLESGDAVDLMKLHDTLEELRRMLR